MHCELKARQLLNEPGQRHFQCESAGDSHLRRPHQSERVLREKPFAVGCGPVAEMEAGVAQQVAGGGPETAGGINVAGEVERRDYRGPL